MDTLRDKVAVITGAGSGRGRAIACALAGRGARIVAVDIDSDRLEAVAGDLSEAGVLVQPADVSDPQAFEGIRGAALRRFGRVDIVVNNVGVLTNGLPSDIPVAEWQRTTDINLMSVVRSNAAFLPLLLDQGSGHLFNTASFAGLFTYSYDRLPYAAIKATIVQISEGLAIYLRPKNIGVSLLCPGPVLTNIAAAVPKFGGGHRCGSPASNSSRSTPHQSASWSPTRSCATDSSYPPTRMSWTSCAVTSRTGTPTSTTRYPANPGFNRHRKADTDG